MMDIACFLTFNFNLSAPIYWTLRQLNLDSLLGRQRLFIDSLKTHPFGRSQKERRGYYPWENDIFNPSFGKTVIASKCTDYYVSFTWGDYVNPGKSGTWKASNRLSWQITIYNLQHFNFRYLVGNDTVNKPIEQSEFFARVSELLSICGPDYQCKDEVEFI